MKKCLSLLMALVLLLGILPFRAEAKVPETILPEGPKPVMPADIGDNTYREVESNNSANLADVVRNDYTVNAGLTPYDLIDFFYFELSSRSDVFIVALAQYSSLMYGILDGNADEVLAAGVFDSYTDNGKSFFVLDTTLPAGEYYIIFMDEDDYYNEYTFYTEFTPTGSSHTHSYYYDYTVSPTCTSDGYSVYSCSCGDYYYDNYTAATGHHFSGGYCTNCGEEDPDYAEPIENPFTDVKEADYFFNPVMWAVQNGITSGLNATTFGPNNSCTRAQVVTFLWRANGQPEPTSTNNPFTDVTAADYFYKPVLWAVENGITAGTSATTFGPNNPCTRGQVVTFLWRANGQPAPESSTNPFADVKEADYFFNPVLWAVENGITSGMNATTFGPNNSCTRGQVVTFLFRADGIDVPDEPVTPPTEPEEPTEPPTEPTEPPTEPTEPPTEPTEPSEPGRELQQSEIELKLQIPTNGGMNAYTTVRFTNRSDMDIIIPSMFTCNGKLVNMDDAYVLSSGYYVDLTFYRAIIPSERYNSKWYDMYLDNNSIGVIVLEWNSDQYYVEFGVNGIVEFYRGNVNGPATDPVGPDPDEPTPPPTEPEEPEQPSDIIFYQNHPAVPDLGVVANASLLMGGTGGAYYYNKWDVSSSEMSAYKDLLEECGFVYQKTTYGTIIDFDYDTYKHSTMDITVDVGYWTGNPLGDLAVVEVEGSDANQAPSGGGSTEPGMAYYPGYDVVPDFGALYDADPLGVYDSVFGVGDYYVYDISLFDYKDEYVSLLLEEGFDVQYYTEDEYYYYDVFWHPDADLTVEIGKCAHVEWGWSTIVDIYEGDPREPDHYGPAPEEPEPTEPEPDDTLNPDPDDVEPYLTYTGYGDDVITGISLPAGEWYCEYFNVEDRYFSIKLYYGDGQYDYTLLANESDPCTGQAFLEDTINASVSNGVMEVQASGSWTIHFKRVSGTTTTNIRGYGNIVTGTFVATSSRAVFHLTNVEDRYFSVKIYEVGGGEYDYELLANESDPYSGNVTETLVVGQEYFFVVEASGEWTIDMGLGDPVTTYVQPDGVGGNGGSTPGGGGGNGGGTTDYVGYDICPSVPDFGAFVGGVEPWMNDEESDWADYTYRASEVYASAGSDAVSDYISLLQSLGFRIIGGSDSGVIGLTHNAWDIDVSIYIVTISTGEQISITIRF